MNNQRHQPNILLLTPRAPNWLGSVFQKSFEKNDWIVTASFDNDPMAAIALLQEKKFDAVFYVCPEVWEEGRGGTIGENAWTILEKKSNTLNATTPTIAYTTSPAEEDVCRMRALGVCHIFEYWNSKMLKPLLQAVRDIIC